MGFYLINLKKSLFMSNKQNDNLDTGDYLVLGVLIVIVALVFCKIVFPAY